MNFADKRVLIIEDQRPFLLVLRGLLHSMGATEVVTKSSAEQALAVCRKRKFDIIISDLHLGTDRKNGFEFIEEMKTQGLAKADCIVMIISADSTRPFVLGSLERTPDDYLIKPFSQSQLQSRIDRCRRKRQVLLPIYQALEEDDLPAAQLEAEKLFKTNKAYRGSIAQLLVEIYGREELYERALEILNDFDADRPVPWLQNALARNWLKLGEVEKAREIASAVVERHRFSAEAYDVIAECELATEQYEKAVETISHALKLSPYSVERHQIASEIARRSANYEMKSESAQAIWMLSRKVSRQNASVWCNYVDSILEVAEHAPDKSTRNKYQHEAHLAVQRGRHDDYLQRYNEDFDFNIYESLFNARLHSLNGKLLEAKRALSDGQEAISGKYDEYPQSLIPDSVKVLYAVGEFDDAEALAAQLKDQQRFQALESTVKSDKSKASQNRQLYAMHNKEGISHYQAGDYKAARAAFAKALQYAPVNTGVALNLLQCIAKLMHTKTNEEAGLFGESKRLLKMLDGMPMKLQFRQKFAELKTELEGLTGQAA